MSLLEQWRAEAYNAEDKNALSRLWKVYFTKEKGIYQQLLANPDEVVKGTVSELAEKYNVELLAKVR